MTTTNKGRKNTPKREYGKTNEYIRYTMTVKHH